MFSCVIPGFKSHTDCIEGGRDQRDRYATVVVYLSTVPSGGQTNFPGKAST